MVINVLLLQIAPIEQIDTIEPMRGKDAQLLLFWLVLLEQIEQTEQIVPIEPIGLIEQYEPVGPG